MYLLKYACMKIIVVEPVAGGNKPASPAFDLIKQSARIAVLGDTALLTHGKPVFVPSLGGECSATLCLALRICRLGKSIPQRFATRYCDAIALAMKFELTGLKASLAGEGLSSSVAENFDGAVECGEFRPWPDGADVEISLNAGNVLKQLCVPHACETASEAIAAASTFMSIRQGDVMLLPLRETAFPAAVNTHVAAWLGEDKVLEFNIK